MFIRRVNGKFQMKEVEMHMAKTSFCLAVLITVLSAGALANSPPVVSNVTASQRTDGVFPPGPSGIVWVDINDPGVSGHEGFIGQMSKYETTNAQYAQYLNSALAAGMITVDSNVVYDINDISKSGRYFKTYAASSKSQITYSGGTFSVRTRDSNDMSNHPVVEVSWYGATAFCNYYGYRLPTEWEWQAVADFDGSYIYGCGMTIDHNKANYESYNPLGLSSLPYTTPVDYYETGGRPGPYGYGMCDMAGNVLEWTSSCYDPSCDLGSRFLRGGSWNVNVNYCTVSYRSYKYPSSMSLNFRNVTYINSGFRVCR